MVRCGVSYCSRGMRIPRLHPSSNTKLKIWIILAKKVLSSYSKNRKDRSWKWNLGNTQWVSLIIIEMTKWTFVHNQWLVHTSEIYVGHVDLCISTSITFFQSQCFEASQDKFKMWKLGLIGKVLNNTLRCLF